MRVAKNTYKLLLLTILILGIKNEILKTLSSGMGYIQEKAVMIPYSLGKTPNTAISLYGMNYYNKSIILCDEEDNIIFVYMG